MNRQRVCDWVMVAAGCAFLAGIITWAQSPVSLSADLTGAYYFAAAAGLCALGLWLDPDSQHGKAREHRRQQRAAILAEAREILGGHCPDCQVIRRVVFHESGVMIADSELLPCPAHADPESTELEQRAAS